MRGRGHAASAATAATTSAAASLSARRQGGAGMGAHVRYLLAVGAGGRCARAGGPVGSRAPASAPTSGSVPQTSADVSEPDPAVRCSGSPRPARVRPTVAGQRRTSDRLPRATGVRCRNRPTGARHCQSAGQTVPHARPPAHPGSYASPATRRCRDPPPARDRALGLVLGAALDAAFGDPRRGHPVAGFGRAAGSPRASALGRLAAPRRRVHRRRRRRTRRSQPPRSSAGRRPGWPAPCSPPRPPGPCSAPAAWPTEGRVMAALLADAERDGDLGPARARLSHLAGRDPSRAGRRRAEPGQRRVAGREHLRRGRRPAAVGRRGRRAGLVGYRAVEHAGRDGRPPHARGTSGSAGRRPGWTTSPTTCRRGSAPCWRPLAGRSVRDAVPRGLATRRRTGTPARTPVRSRPRSPAASASGSAARTSTAGGSRTAGTLGTGAARRVRRPGARRAAVRARRRAGGRRSQGAVAWVLGRRR